MIRSILVSVALLANAQIAIGSEPARERSFPLSEVFVTTIPFKVVDLRSYRVELKSASTTFLLQCDDQVEFENPNSTLVLGGDLVERLTRVRSSVDQNPIVRGRHTHYSGQYDFYCQSISQPNSRSLVQVLEPWKNRDVEVGFEFLLQKLGQTESVVLLQVIVRDTNGEEITRYSSGAYSNARFTSRIVNP